jgi:hypothetical protein
MKSRLQSIAQIAALLVLTIACDKKEEQKPKDTTRPTINSSTHLHGLMNGRITAGSKLEVHYKVQDDVELRELKIDIHNNFDGHSHGRLSGGAAFEWDTIIRLGGTSREQEIDVMIPATALAGPYHVGLFVTDASGNQGDSKYLDFEITSPSQPSIMLNGLLAYPQENDMEPGDTLVLNGTASDNEALEEIEIKIEEEEHEGGRISGSIGGTPLYKREFKPSTHASLFTNGNKEFNFSNIAVADRARMPANIPSGQHKDFELLVKAKDTDGNVRLVKYKLHVH